MSSVPVSLLKKLYVKNSLRNAAAGFEFIIQNTLAPGTIIGFVLLQIDGIKYPLAQVKISLSDGHRISASDVSVQSPLHLAIGDKATIQVEGATLPAGLHKLTISFKTKEAGVVQIFAEDAVI